jgi:small subunit ribosomal protein S8
MYTDLLIRIKNAQSARKETIKVPYSGMDIAIAEVLARNNFIESAAKKGRLPKRVIEIKLKYGKGGGAIEGVRLKSRPSLRIYSGYRAFRPVRQGRGIAVVSTPRGVMTSREARAQKVGGQVLFEIW